MFSIDGRLFLMYNGKSPIDVRRVAGFGYLPISIKRSGGRVMKTKLATFLFVVVLTGLSGCACYDGGYGYYGGYPTYYPYYGPYYGYGPYFNGSIYVGPRYGGYWHGGHGGHHHH